MSYSYVTSSPTSPTPPTKGSELDGVDIITLFESAANTFFNSKFTEFTGYAQDLLSIALVFYFLFQIITSAMVNDTKAVKMMGATFLWVCVVTVLTKEATYNYWVIDTMNSLRNGLVSYFVGSQNDTVWDLVKTGLILGQDTAMGGKGSYAAQAMAFLYGSLMWLTYFTLYFAYALVYIGALVPLLVLQFLGGAILLLASIEKCRGMAFGWLQAMFKYTLICAISTLLVAMCVSISNVTAGDVLLGDDGIMSMKFFIAIMSSWITIKFLPKSAEIVTDIVGGSTPSTAGDTQAGVDLAKSMKSPASNAGSKAGGFVASKAGGAAVNAAMGMANKAKSWLF